MIDIKSAAVGRWASILTLLGIDAKYLNGKHGPCCLCGGKDRGRWSRSTEHYHCNQCGSYSAMDLAIAYTGTPFKDLAQEIKKSILGIATVTTAPEYNANEIDKNKARLESIHKTLSVIGKQELSLSYFKARGLSVLPEKDCYWSSGVPYYEDGKKVGVYNAICSVFRTADGETCSYHITYIEDGKKASVESPKKILPAIRSLSGASIQLFKADKVLGIAEGIETALAVHELEGIPVWATGNAQLMASFEIPETVEELWIYADSDANFTGQKAAYALANKAALKGIKTRVCIVQDGNKWLTDYGEKADFLDYLILKKHEKRKQAA